MFDKAFWTLGRWIKQTADTMKTYVDNAIVTATIGLFDDRGVYDASGNTFPATGGSGTAGAILKGDIWTISVAGTLGGTAVKVGDTVRALCDTPAQTAGNWAIMEMELGYVPVNKAGDTMTGDVEISKTLPEVKLTNLATGKSTYINRTASGDITKIESDINVAGANGTVGPAAIDRAAVVGSTLTFLALDNPVTVAGSLLSVKIYCAAATTVKVKIFRPSGLYLNFIGDSELFAITTGLNDRTLTSPITGVQAGDLIGCYCPSGTGGYLDTDTSGEVLGSRYDDGDITSNKLISDWLSYRPTWTFSIQGTTGVIGGYEKETILQSKDNAGGGIKGELDLGTIGGITKLQGELYTPNIVAKTTPIAADSDLIVDSADSNKIKTVTLTNKKAYWDLIYAAIAKGVTNGDTHDHNGGDGAVIPLAGMSNLAASSILGNNTGSPATPIALTTAQVKTLLGGNVVGYRDQSGLAVYDFREGTASKGIANLVINGAWQVNGMNLSTIVPSGAKKVKLCVFGMSTTAGTVLYFAKNVSAGTNPGIIIPVAGQWLWSQFQEVDLDTAADDRCIDYYCTFSGTASTTMFLLINIVGWEI